MKKIAILTLAFVFALGFSYTAYAEHESETECEEGYTLTEVQTQEAVEEESHQEWVNDPPYWKPWIGHWETVIDVEAQDAHFEMQCVEDEEENNGGEEEETQEEGRRVLGSGSAGITANVCEQWAKIGYSLTLNGENPCDKFEDKTVEEQVRELQEELLGLLQRLALQLQQQ